MKTSPFDLPWVGKFYIEIKIETNYIVYSLHKEKVKEWYFNPVVFLTLVMLFSISSILNVNRL